VFLICYCSLTGIYVVFGAFTNMESFLRCAKGMQLAKLIGCYYGYQSIFFFDRTSGLLTLMAAMFTVTWIQRHNEMTALMAAGISKLRVVMPLIIGAIVIDCFAAVNRECIIPSFREQLSRDASDPLGDVGQRMEPQDDVQTDVLFRGEFTYAGQQRLSKPNLLLPASLSQHGKQLRAENAFYHAAEAGRPAGYLLVNVLEPKHLDRLPSLYLQRRPVLITPRDAAWLKPHECFVASDVTFEQLSGGRGFRSFASTAELIRALRNRSLDFGLDIRVTIHGRIVKPLLDITLLFLGLPLVVSRHSRNVFWAIGLCLAIVTLFLLLCTGLEEMGKAGYLITPALAAWAPLILFVPPAVALAESMGEQ